MLNGVCFESNSFTLFAIIGSIVCAELIHFVFTSDCLYVYNFCPVLRLIIEHEVSTSKLG